MCLLILKTKDSELPNNDILQNAWNNNSHGAWFAYTNWDWIVHIKKWYMEYKDFINAINWIWNVKDYTMLIHFRLATHWSNWPWNTHPFPLSNNNYELTNTNIQCKTAVWHNWVISITEKDNVELSDTQIFIKHILANPLIYNNIKDPAISLLVSNFLWTYNKVAILNWDWSYNIINESKWVWKEWIRYSNSFSFKSYNIKHFAKKFALDINDQVDKNNKLIYKDKKNKVKLYDDWYWYSVNIDWIVTYIIHKQLHEKCKICWKRHTLLASVHHYDTCIYCYIKQNIKYVLCDVCQNEFYKCKMKTDQWIVLCPSCFKNFLN